MDTPAYTPIARFRSLPSGKVTAISDSEAGAASAPPMPWTTREQRDARDEDPASSEQVAHPPAEQQQAAEGERVGVDDPLQVRTGEVQRVLNMRQCDVDDGRVEHDHQLSGRDDHEREPEPPRRRLPAGRHAGCPAADRDGSTIRLA
jgi:hypothetical protein